MSARAIAAGWIVAAGLGLGGAGCGDSSSGAGCVDNRECDLPKVCLDGQCVTECRGHIDCAQGSLCLEFVCKSPRDRCFVDADCDPFGMICDRAGQQCVSGTFCDPATNPCPNGQICDRGMCIISGEDAGGPTPMRDATVEPRMDSSTGGEDDAELAEPDARPMDHPDTEPMGSPDAAPMVGDREYGQTCTGGPVCRSGLCVENKLHASRVCTSECQRSPDCPGLDICYPVPNTDISVCVPNETGLTCNSPRGCTSGICLGPPDPMVSFASVQSICVDNCEDDGKCPGGYTCQDTNAGGGQVIRVCAPDIALTLCPGGDRLLCGGVCPAPAQIEAEVVQCIATDGDGYCSCSCASVADCPRGFSCEAVNLDSGDPARPGLCLALGGYNCGGEAIDPQNLQCLSLSCLVDDEIPAASMCTSLCRGDNDCPAGFRCELLDDGQTRACRQRR